MPLCRVVGDEGLSVWSKTGNELRLAGPTRRKAEDLYFGDPEWKDYDFTADILIEKQGEVGFWVSSSRQDRDRWKFDFCAFGGKDNTDLLACVEGLYPWKDPSRRFKRNKLDLQFNKWYSVKFIVRGPQVQVLVDGRFVCKSEYQSLNGGRCGLHSYGRPVAHFRNLQVKSTDGRVLWDGVPNLNKVIVGKFKKPENQNFEKGSVWEGTRHTEKSGTVKKAVMYIADRNEDKFTGTLAVTNPRGVNQLQIEGAIQGQHITISCESDKGQPSTVSGQINGEELILIGDNPDSGTQTYSLKPVDSIEDGDKSTDKFVKLWNGKDIEGWEFPFGQVKLESKDGILNATWTNRVYQALVTKKDDYENFHLKVRMRIDSKSLGSELNTHWFIRGNQARDGMFGWAFSLGGKKSNTRDGLLFADMGKFRLLTGGRIVSSAHSIAVPKNKGTVDGVTATGPITKAVSLDEWHDLDFLAYGNTVSMIVDGKLVTTATDNKDRIRKGEIGLRPQRNAHLQFEVFEVLELGSNSEAEMYAKQLLEAL